MHDLRARWSQALARRGAVVRTWWAAQRSRDRRLIVGAGSGVLLGLLVGGVVVAATSGGGEADDSGPPDVVVSTETPTASPSSEPSEPTASRPCAGLESLPWECGDAEQFPPGVPREPPIPTVRSIDELHSQYGEPPGATFARMRIPVLGVDAPVGGSLVGGNGVMSNPSGPSDVVWYDFSGFDDGVGGAPGGGHNAIYSGHVDYAALVPYAGVYYRGGGVFRNIGLLSPGDVIEVLVNGQTLTYTVVWERQVTADTSVTNWNEIFTSRVPVDSLTLITCGGDFNSAQRSYFDRIVVRAVRA